jgi:hypothetical protein
MKPMFFCTNKGFLLFRVLTANRVSLNQSSQGSSGIMMQATEELPGKLGIRQAISMNQISLVGDKLDLVE